MSARFQIAMVAAAIVLVTGITAPVHQATATPTARSELYSLGATNRFCIRAQQIIASTALYAENINHNSLFTFANASSAPYQSANLGSYNGTLALYPDANVMPLITQQLISHRELTQTGWEYPIVISCKMKNAEAINYHFGPGSAGTQQTCREVNMATVADVYASLTAIEQRMLRWTQSQIVYPTDLQAAAGPVWLYPLPYLPRVAFIGSDGRLRLRGFAISVERTNPSDSAGPDKKGTYYCHLPAPEYVRALVTGQMQPILETPPEY